MKHLQNEVAALFEAAVRALYPNTSVVVQVCRGTRRYTAGFDPDLSANTVTLPIQPATPRKVTTNSTLP
jgi:hypothetical protein